MARAPIFYSFKFSVSKTIKMLAEFWSENVEGLQ